jgi:cephalosporin hydroxylase
MPTQDDIWWTDTDNPPVPTHQHPREFDALLALYMSLCPRCVLEIGSWHGGTLKQWIKRAPRGAMVVSIDLGTSNPEQWHTWARDAGIRLFCLAGRSQEPDIIDEARRLGPYDFAFIDGDHTYEAVKADFENYRTMMAPGGVMAFHDILAHERYPDNQVRRVWDEIVAAGYPTSELIENHSFSWGGIGICYL